MIIDYESHPLMPKEMCNVAQPLMQLFVFSPANVFLSWIKNIFFASRFFFLWVSWYNMLENIPVGDMNRRIYFHGKRYCCALER